ncbi:MAG: 3-isopropylmalate dehydratase small subunit [Candidatus Tectimicrobiota bacterium]|nr:MAG: 3-isopropylmalate dehydratase small subunit [Candidatus Tectomicrobia bacterium]
MRYRGRVWTFGDNINTDLMMPQVAFRLPLEEQVKYVFRANRPGWVEQVREGDILVAGRNFGTGSSRPAARLLRHLGITCVVAESLNGLFFRNCVNFALAPVQCPGVRSAFTEGDTAEVDLVAGTVTNLRTGACLQGEPLPELLRQIIAAGGLIPLLQQQGYLE